MNERPTEPFGRPSGPAEPSGGPSDATVPVDEVTGPSAPAGPTGPSTTSDPVATPEVPTTPVVPSPHVVMATPVVSGPTAPTVASTPTGDARPTTAAFSPTPERLDRDRVAWETPVQPTPEAWFEPVPAAAAVASAPVQRRSGGGILGPVLAASLLSAILASGATYGLLRASGALNTPAPVAAVPTGQSTSLTTPVTIDESSAIVDVAAKVSPAVVRIFSTANANLSDPNTIPSEGVGSGIIYDANGWILTNRHVVAGSDKLVVQLKDGREFEGTIYGIDTLTDLAIVKVEATGLPVAALGDSSKLKVGQTTIAIGSPLGTYSSTVTSGILSATGRSIDVDGGTINNLLQTDTAINPGNSGGPLLDAGGNVIGINTAIAANANGIGFAIPVNIARPIMQQAIAGEKLARPYIGIRYEMLTDKRAKELNLSVVDGAYVDGGQATNGAAQAGVVPNGPADQAGVHQGDVVVAIEGQPIDTEHPLDSVLTQFAPGTAVTLSVLRDGQKLDLKVTLGTRPADL